MVHGICQFIRIFYSAFSAGPPSGDDEGLETVKGWRRLRVGGG